MLWIRWLLPTPLWPTKTRFWLRRTKSQAASVSICTLLIAGLKFQSNSAKGFSSRKQASLMRLCRLRWRRSPAWSASKRCRNSRCDQPLSWACFKARSSWSAVMGMRKVAKSARISSRRFGAVGAVFFGLIAVFLRQEQMLIVAGRARADGFLAQTGIQGFSLQVGEFVEQGFGLGAGGEDASDRGQGEGAKADGPLEGGTHVVAWVVGYQRQQLLGLPFALDLLGQEAIEELLGDRAQFAIALPQEPFPLAGIVAGMMTLECLANAGVRAAQQRMTRDFLQAGRVDDHFTLGNAYR